MSEYMKSLLMGVLVALGGVVGIVVLILRCFVDTIVSRLHQKYEVKLQLEVEDFKNELTKEIIVFTNKHSALQDLSCAFLSLFDVIAKCTKDYEEDSNRKPTADKCLEIKNLVENAKKTFNKAIPIIEDDFMKSFEKILEHLNNQYERLCCKINGSVPYTVSVMEPDKKDFMDNISRLQKSIYDQKNLQGEIRK